MRDGLYRTLACCVAMMAPVPATAGPWARDPGQLFLAYSLQSDRPDPTATARSYAGAYLEYGIGDGFTLGGALGTNPAGDYKVTGFLRSPPATLAGGVLVAMEVGTGMLGDRPVLVPGVSFGRGVAVGGAGGWWTADARALLPFRSRDWDLEGEVALGVDSSARLKLITQLQAALRPDDAPALRWETLMVWEVLPGHHLQAGINVGIANSRGFGIKLGMWHRF